VQHIAHKAKVLGRDGPVGSCQRSDSIEDTWCNPLAPWHGHAVLVAALEPFGREIRL